MSDFASVALLSVSIRRFRVNFPRGWEAAATRCKVMEFLSGSAGRRIVSDFHAKLKKYDGSRFAESFENAVEDLASQYGAYWMIGSQSLRGAYQSLENDVLRCLVGHVSEVNALKIVAICIFWVLHGQDASV